MDDQTTRLHEALIERLNEHMKDSIHTIEGAPTATLKLSDGTFRKKPVFGGQELFYEGAYIGKSRKLILVFKPVDDMQWEQAEFTTLELDKALPLFGGTLAEKCSYPDLEDVTAVVERIMTDLPAQWAREAEEARKAAEATYATNPNFGRF